VSGRPRRGRVSIAEQGLRNDQHAVWVGVCSVDGKRCYLNRREAKKALKQHTRRHEMSVYECGNWWHLGHLPKAVKTGRKTRDQIRSNEA
jgi:hypothetical protein